MTTKQYACPNCGTVASDLRFGWNYLICLKCGKSGLYEVFEKRMRTFSQWRDRQIWTPGLSGDQATPKAPTGKGETE